MANNATGCGDAGGRAFKRGIASMVGNKERSPLSAAAVSAAWKLDESYWSHGLTISLGNGWNVNQDNVEKLLHYIAFKLLRAMFGNNYRKRAKIRFIGFKQGSKSGGNQHFHVLMHIEGSHDWPDEKIKLEIQKIDSQRTKNYWEKPIHIDCDWYTSNRFHQYCCRDLYSDLDAYFIIG